MSGRLNGFLVCRPAPPEDRGSGAAEMWELSWKVLDNIVMIQLPTFPPLDCNAMTLRHILFLFAAASLMLSHATPHAGAQKKNGDDADLAKARKRINELERRIDQLEGALKKSKNDDKGDDKRIANLQQDVRERDKKIDQLEAALKKAKAAMADPNQNAQFERELKAREQKVLQIQNALDALKLERKNEQVVVVNLRKDSEKLKRDLADLEFLQKGNAVYSAYYRLKKDLDPKLADAFLADAPKKLGKFPGIRGLWVGAPAVRGSEQAGFDVGVIAIFDDPDSLRRFLDHPLQKQFNEGVRRSWDPVIYNLHRD